MAQVVVNPIALAFKATSSLSALKSIVENQATHYLGAARLG
jgi:hypothetical protein